jgi:hypothetical protein
VEDRVWAGELSGTHRLHEPTRRVPPPRHPPNSDRPTSTRPSRTARKDRSKSEPNSVHNVEGMATPERADDVERVEGLAETWNSSPLTDPIEAPDSGARPIAELGNSGSRTRRAGAARTSDRGASRSFVRLHRAGWGLPTGRSAGSGMIGPGLAAVGYPHKCQPLPPAPPTGIPLASPADESLLQRPGMMRPRSPTTPRKPAGSWCPAKHCRLPGPRSDRDHHW